MQMKMGTDLRYLTKRENVEGKSWRRGRRMHGRDVKSVRLQRIDSSLLFGAMADGEE